MTLIKSYAKASVYRNGDAFVVTDNATNTTIFAQAPEGGKALELASSVRKFAEEWPGFPLPAHPIPPPPPPTLASTSEVDAALSVF